MILCIELITNALFKTPIEFYKLVRICFVLEVNSDFRIFVNLTSYQFLFLEFVLHGMAKGNPKEFVEKIFHLCVGDFWKERISEVSCYQVPSAYY